VFLAVLFPPVLAYQRANWQKGPIPNIKKGSLRREGGERGGSRMYWARPQSHFWERMALVPGMLVL
jgi:hypothetical protein